MLQQFLRSASIETATKGYINTTAIVELSWCSPNFSDSTSIFDAPFTKWISRFQQSTDSIDRKGFLAAYCRVLIHLPTQKVSQFPGYQMKRSKKQKRRIRNKTLATRSSNSFSGHLSRTDGLEKPAQFPSKFLLFNPEGSSDPTSKWEIDQDRDGENPAQFHSMNPASVES
ncbi:hypothetical protein BaRGS_00010328 [Batillaria attramentaria]|uniref:Uncharacterized protein n=1 Tax=Batillaria attramentaria TaxID=370345 RepID=A0ABD0LFL4_9CAEN